jgi:hypothetical protein
MATLTFGKSHFTIGAHGNQSQVREQERPSFMSTVYRFMESAQVLADRYADYKYNETDWRAIRP